MKEDDKLDSAVNLRDIGHHVGSSASPYYSYLIFKPGGCRRNVGILGFCFQLRPEIDGIVFTRVIESHLRIHECAVPCWTRFGALNLSVTDRVLLHVCRYLLNQEDRGHNWPLTSYLSDSIYVGNEVGNPSPMLGLPEAAIICPFG